MFKIKLYLFAAFTLLLISCSKKTAVITNNREGWHKIGQHTVDFKSVRDELALVGATGFSKLHLVAFDATVFIQKMEVYYENGKQQDFNFQKPLKEDDQSFVVDLPGIESSITKVAFIYKTLPNEGKDKAMIELYGYKMEKK